MGLGDTHRCPLYEKNSAGIYPDSDLTLGDNNELYFGNAPDVTIKWDATNLLITAAADDSIIEIGDAYASAALQKSFDLKWYGGTGTGGSYLYGDASANALYTVGVDLWVKDNDFIGFGSHATNMGDVKITWDATNLIVSAATDDAIIEIGDAGASAAAQKSFDLKIYGGVGTGGSYALFDAGSSRLDMTEYALGKHQRLITAATTATAVAAADSGTIFTTQGTGGAVNFTLPAKANGLNYMFVNAENQTMTVTPDAVDTLITYGDIEADSLAFDQATSKLGAAAFVFCDGTNWFAIPMCSPSAVATSGGTFFTVNT